MDVEKQIEYWRSNGQGELKAVDALFNKRLYPQALFFAHLAVKKLLKAHVTRHAKQVPPKIHNLARLAELGGLSLTAEQQLLCRDLGVYQLEGRYQDMEKSVISRGKAAADVARTKEFVQWLTERL